MMDEDRLGRFTERGKGKEISWVLLFTVVLLNNTTEKTVIVENTHKFKIFRGFSLSQLKVIQVAIGNWVN